MSGLTAAEAARIPADIRQMADCTIPITLAEARALPNLLGRIVPAVLRHQPFYTCTVDGVRTLYVRREPAPYPLADFQGEG